jgi:hypothetical protein
MFFIVKSKKTDKCKALHYLSDINNYFSVEAVNSEFRDSDILYRIQYKNGFWLMGYLNLDSNYIGEEDMFKILEFEDEFSCEFFLKVMVKNFNKLESKLLGYPLTVSPITNSKNV